MASLRKDGRWVARAKTGTKTRAFYGATEQEAEERKRDFLISTTTWEITQATTLHDFAVASWRPTLNHLQSNSRERYLDAYRQHIRPILGPLSLASISRADVQQFVNGLLARGKPMAPHGVHFVYLRLKSILTLAEQDGVIGKSPCNRIALPRLPEKRHRILSVEDTLRVIEHCDGTPIACPVFLAVRLGLRRGEVAALKWSDFNGNKVTIQRQRGGSTKGNSIEREHTKSRKPRTLDLPASVIEGIKTRGDQSNEYVCTHRGKPWVADTIKEFWEDERAKLKMPEWTFHDLRHLAAGLIVASGGSLIEVAAVLGHKTLDTTLEYISLMEGSTRKTLKRLDRMMSGDTQ